MTLNSIRMATGNQSHADAGMVRRGLPLGWVAAGLLVQFLVPATTSNEPNRPFVLLYGVLTLALGLWIFWWNGGSQVTAAGLFSITAAIVGGFASIWWARQPEPLPSTMRWPPIICFWGLLLMYTLWWRSFRTFSKPRLEDGLRSSVLPAGLATALIGTGIGLASSRYGVHTAFAGLATLMTAILITGEGTKRPWLRFGAALSLVALFSEFVFTGYGRLIIATLALYTTVICSTYFGRRLKLVVVAATPIALTILVQMRVAFGASQGKSFDGLGSVVNPLNTLGRLIDSKASGAFSFGLGDSYLGSLTFLLPRSIWSSKPPGFGSRLTEILDPELTALGHSEASFVFGEGFYNFGWAGIGLVAIVAGWGIRQLDRGFWRITSRPISSMRNFVFLVLAALAMGDIMNLMWGDSFAFSTRFVQQAIFIGIALAPFAPSKVAHPKRGCN